MHYGSPWSEAFIDQISDREIRNEFVSDQVRTRIAMLIRALREQPDRAWSQTRLGQEMGKPQSVVSRIEDPDYGKLSLQTLFDVAAAFDLPLWVDIPEWEDWLVRIRDVPNSATGRKSFDKERLSGFDAPITGRAYIVGNNDNLISTPSISNSSLTPKTYHIPLARVAS
jgi:hypothetical protein